MAGEVERDQTQLRIGDTERHQVAEILREAAGEGRLDLDELDSRLEATYAARTYADLVPITLDLPAHPHPAPVTRAASSLVVPGPERETHLAIMSGFDRRGAWTVPTNLTVLALWGSAELDLRQARFAAQEVVLTINAIMGSATVIVPPHVNLQMEGTGIMGGYSAPSGLVDAQLDATSPTVRIRGIAIMGGVNVERKHGS